MKNAIKKNKYGSTPTMGLNFGLINISAAIDKISGIIKNIQKLYLQTNLSAAIVAVNLL